MDEPLMKEVRITEAKTYVVDKEGNEVEEVKKDESDEIVRNTDRRKDGGR